MLENIKSLAHLVSSGVIDSVTVIVSSLPAPELATVTLSAIDNIIYRDLRSASLIIHPGMCGLPFLSQDALHDVESKSEAFVRKMLQEYCLHIRTEDPNSFDKTCCEPVTPVGSNPKLLLGC